MMEDIFESVYTHIYPSELKLKDTSISPHKSNYLGMSRHGFFHKLYGKRNDFDFKLLSIPNR